MYVVWVCLAMLVAAGGLALGRVVRRGASVADRIVALDLLLLIGVMAIAVYSVLRDTGAYLDVLVVVSLIGFVSTITVARFIERRGI
jgi:multicomponent Na+:H+ antiporter subunit F